MKRAIVTGGTRGIGLAVCRQLEKEGYSVIATYSQNEEDAFLAREALPTVQFIRTDVSSEEEIKKLFSTCASIDLLVCNAGVSLFGQVQDTTRAEYDRVMNVNMLGTFLCCKYAVKKMLDKGGAIITVSSIWGEEGGSCESVYSASKGAVIAFTKALAKELAPSNIIVNCVSPGVIDTRMNERIGFADMESLKEEIPLGRLGSADEVAAAIVFLAEQKYITGQVLGVNGGFFIP